MPPEARMRKQTVSNLPKQPPLVWSRLQAWLLRRLLVNYGPAMVKGRGHWLYFDFYGDVYRLTETGRPGEPLIITRESR